MRRSIMCILVSLFMFLGGCTSQSDGTSELASFAADDLDGIVSKGKVLLDADSRDGGGSLSITTEEPVTVRLYETGDLDVEDAMLVYQAAVKSRDLNGVAYLELRCVFADGREFFSRGLNSPWTGSIPWSVVETPFFLKRGQNPTNIRLNLVIDGSGTVWIDQLRLLRAPLKL